MSASQSGSASALSNSSSLSSTSASTASSAESPPDCLPSSCRLLYISGDQAGVGKSSVAIAVLHLLQRRHGVSAAELGYIKPCTQCEDLQLVGSYCQRQRIQHVDIGPVVFYSGYTQQCIDGTAADTESQRHASIRHAVFKLAQGKRFVVVDGVGYPAVGSVCGVSNGTVARLLSAPVLLVSRGGVGNAIDATNYMLGFFLQHAVRPVGVVYNKLPPPAVADSSAAASSSSSSSSHPYERCVQYTSRYFASRQPKLSVYGHIPMLQTAEAKEGEGEEDQKVCIIRGGGKAAAELTARDERRLAAWLALAEQHFNSDGLIADIELHYASAAAADVTVA